MFLVRIKKRTIIGALFVCILLFVSLFFFLKYTSVSAEEGENPRKALSLSSSEAQPSCSRSPSSAGSFCLAGYCLSLADWKTDPKSPFGRGSGLNNYGLFVKDHNDDDCDGSKNYQDECPDTKGKSECPNDEEKKSQEFCGCPLERPWIYNARSTGTTSVKIEWCVRGDEGDVYISRVGEEQEVVGGPYHKTKDNYEECFEYTRWNSSGSGEAPMTYAVWVRNGARKWMRRVEVLTTDTRDKQDNDSDGIVNFEDNCIFEPGPSSNGGCPLYPTFSDLEYEWRNGDCGRIGCNHSNVCPAHVVGTFSNATAIMLRSVDENRFYKPTSATSCSGGSCKVDQWFYRCGTWEIYAYNSLNFGSHPTLVSTFATTDSEVDEPYPFNISPCAHGESYSLLRCKYLARKPNPPWDNGYVYDHCKPNSLEKYQCDYHNWDGPCFPDLHHYDKLNCQPGVTWKNDKKEKSDSIPSAQYFLQPPSDMGSAR